MYVVPENIHTPRWKEFEKAYPHPTTQPQGLGLGLSLSLSLSLKKYNFSGQTIV